MKEFMKISLVIFFLWSLPVIAQEGLGDSQAAGDPRMLGDNTTEAGDPRMLEENLSADQILAEAAQYLARVEEIEFDIQKMTKEAAQAQDINWKMFLDDALTTLKGILVSVESANNKIQNLVQINDLESAYSQLMLIRGLVDSAEKIHQEALLYKGRLSKIDTETTIEAEEDVEQTGTYNGTGDINASLGVGFTEDFVTETDKAIISTEDLGDAAGTDLVGGPTESPAETNEAPPSVQENINGDINPPTRVQTSGTE